MTDKEVIAAVIQGDADKFELLLKRYNTKFYRIALAFLKDDHETQDAMQSAYLKIFEHLQSFHGQSQFGTWATRILINECKMALRKKRSTFNLLGRIANHLSLNMPQRSTEDALMNQELKHHLEKSILELPTKYRQVFMMREVSGYSTKETADMLALSESNVKTRLHRAKEQMRNKMLSRNQYDTLFDFHLDKCNPFRDRVMRLIRRAAQLA